MTIVNGSDPDLSGYSLPPEAASTPDYVSHGGELELSNPGQLELLCAIQERRVTLRTMVRGFSMHPFVRDRDILTIAPVNNREPNVGDIVAFKKPGIKMMAIHRIVARAGSGWVIRGDNCFQKDGVVMKENIIGRVVRLERAGREVRFGLGAERKLIAFLNRGNALIHVKYIKALPRRGSAFILRKIQALPLYRALGRQLAPAVSIAEASESDLEAIHNLLKRPVTYRRQPEQSNLTTLVARHRGKCIGFVRLISYPEDDPARAGFWLYSLHVKESRRGFGIGEMLVRRAVREAENRGSDRVLLTIYENNRRGIGLYRKLGFCPDNLPALEAALSGEKKKSGRRRVVMHKKLGLADEPKK